MWNVVELYCMISKKYKSQIVYDKKNFLDDTIEIEGLIFFQFQHTVDEPL